MNCEECEESPSAVRCGECEQMLCACCDEKLHRKGKRQTHARTLICKDCGAAASLACEECHASVCADCCAAHPAHTLSSMKAKKTVAVFWDIASARADDSEEVARVLTQIRMLHGDAAYIRAYGDAPKSVLDALMIHHVTRVVKAGLKEGETMLLDLTTTPRDVSDILVISGLAVSNRNFYLELAASLPGVNLMVSCTCLPLEPKQPGVLGAGEEEKKQSTRNLSLEMRTGQIVILEVVPLYQRFYKKQGYEDVHDSLMSLLRSFAFEGQLMLELNSLISSLQSATMLTADQANAVIRTGATLGLLHLIQRHFGVTRNDVTLCAMKLDSLSLEALTWVLRSLKRDEMMPTERAVQSRIKEAFDFKPSPVQWTNLIEAARARAGDGHRHSSSAPKEKPEGSYSVFGLSFEDDPLRPIPLFQVEDIKDPQTEQETCIIYPKDEVWVALDHHTKEEGDVLNTKGTEEWCIFKQFLENYFIGDRIGKKSSWKRQDDETKAIPGGRYGCAQFLKTCGPPQLQLCSLGRLSYMVQIAIGDELLRYQRTLLIWNSNLQKRAGDEESEYRIKTVQMAIWKVLAENRSGVSLAQLPQHVKKYASIDLNDLGFAKLKDLLATMPEVKIENHGANHPFAVLKPEHSFEKELEDVIECILDLSRESPNGIPIHALERMTVSKLGRTVEWRKMGCQNLMEFVRKWGKSLFFVIRAPDDSFLLKSSGDRKPLSFSKDVVPSPGHSMHMHSVSVTYEGTTHIHQHSGSMFYSLNPLEKVVKTSDLPAEFTGSHKITSSGTSELEDPCPQDKHLSHQPSEEETSISTALHGYDPPHYRTESIEYHSNHPSMGRHDWRKHAPQPPVVEPIYHIKTDSEDQECEETSNGGAGAGFYTPVFNIGPPPGF